MKRFLLSTAVLCVAFVGSGCVNDGDPAKGGFLSGMAHMTTGTYEKRKMEREEALQDQNDEKLRNERTLARVEAEGDAVAAQRRAAEKRFSAFSADLAALRKRISGAKLANVAIERDIKALEAKMAMLQQDTFTPEPERQVRLDQLRKEKELLEQQVDLAIRRR